MKKRYSVFLIFTILFISSCGKHCDVSTAEGAADCTCKLMKEFDEAKGDPDKTKEVSAKYDEFMRERERKRLLPASERGEEAKPVIAHQRVTESDHRAAAHVIFFGADCSGNGQSPVGTVLMS